MAIVLNLCLVFCMDVHDYIKRHDRIFENISNEIPNLSFTIYVNKTMKTCFADVVSSNASGSALKPDSIVKRGPTIIIIDVPCLYYFHNTSVHQENIRKYEVAKHLLIL